MDVSRTFAQTDEVTFTHRLYCPHVCMDLFQSHVYLGNEDFRTIVVDSNIFPQVNGSSRVRIGDSIDVLCSIKVSNVQHVLLTEGVSNVKFICSYSWK